MPARSHSRRGSPGARDAPGGTLDELVGLVLPHLPAGVVGADSVGRIRAAAAALPGELVASFALHRRLGSQTPGAGLSFCADAEHGGLQMLAGRHPLVALPAALAADERLAALIGFARWREADPLLQRATCDAGADLAPLGDLGVGFGMRLDGLVEAPRRPLEVLIRALDIGLGALRGAPLPAAARDATATLARRLPQRARIERAGLVAGAPGAVRLRLARLAPRELVELVGATRGGGEARALAAVLDELVQPPGAVRARVDLGAGLGPRIALVCTVDPQGSPSRAAARWAPLLERLVAAGLCAAGEREALPFSYGLLRERGGEPWPVHLTRLSAVLGDGAESVVRWRLQEIAVACERGEPVEATAQIVAAPGWSRR